MNFDSVVKDAVGQTKEVVPSPKIPFVEISRIPTAGVAVGDTQYLNLMSVKNWGPAGTWDTNFSASPPRPTTERTGPHYPRPTGPAPAAIETSSKAPT